MESKKVSIPLLIGGAVLIIVISAAGIFFVIDYKNQNTVKVDTTTTANTVVNNANTSVVPVSASNSTSNSTTNSTNSQTIANAYKDGTYTVTQSYYTPDNIASVKVAITVASDKITKVLVTPQDGGESGRYETRFANAISSKVVGKTISSATLTSVVSGASLTTDAFNSALVKIMNQAKS